MRCQDAQRFLDAQLARPRPARGDGEDAAVRAHLAGCARCAAFARALTTGLPALKGLPTVPPNPRALAALDRLPIHWWDRPLAHRLRRWTRQMTAIAGLASLVVLVGGLLLTIGQVRPRQPLNSPVAAGAAAGATPATVCGTETTAADKTRLVGVDDALQRAIFEAAAGALNLSPDQLKTSLAAGRSLADLAATQQVDAAQVRAAALAAGQAQLADAVQRGLLTQPEADERAVALPNIIAKLLPIQIASPIPGTPAPAKQPPSAQDEAAFNALSDAVVASAAGQLGLTPAQVQAELGNGRTIGTLAQQRSIALQPLRAAMLAAGQAHLDSAAAGGTLTADQLRTLAAILPAMVDKLTGTIEPRSGTPTTGPGPCGKGTPATGDGAAPNMALIEALRGGAAGALGLAPAALQQEQAAGKSLAVLVAERHGDPEQIKEAMLRAGKERLALAVQRGELTQPQADNEASELPNLTAKLFVTSEQQPGPKATAPAKQP